MKLVALMLGSDFGSALMSGAQKSGALELVDYYLPAVNIQGNFCHKVLKS